MKKDSFFERLKNNKIYVAEKLYTIAAVVLWIHISILYVLFLFSIFTNNYKILNIFSIFLIVLPATLLFYFVGLFYRNNILFKEGDFNKGMTSLTIVGVAVAILLALGLTLGKNEENIEIFKSLIVPIATVFSAILAAMGVNYSIESNKSKMICDKNIILKNVVEGNNKIDLRSNIGTKNIKLFFENVSSNYAYLIGFYKYRDNEVQVLGEKTSHYLIEPQKSYEIFNISIEIDDAIFMVYKDLYSNYYYVHFELYENNSIYRIATVSKCDFAFLEDEIAETAENNKNTKKKNKAKKSKVLKFTKENTVPRNTIKYKNFEIIVDVNGEVITDLNLLDKLKSERWKLSLKHHCKAYMIFSNAQLVSLATYKPLDQTEFISLYGLGENKYNQYGKIMIDAIERHQQDNNKI